MAKKRRWQKRIQWCSAALPANMATDSFSARSGSRPLGEFCEDPPEDVQQLGCVCVEEAPVEVANKFEILADEDEELEFGAPPGMRMRKRCSASAEAQRLRPKKFSMEVTIESGAESVRPISLLSESPTLKIGGKKRCSWQNSQEMGHHGRKQVKFGDAGDAQMLSFEVTNVTKPSVAARRIIEEGNEAHLGAENFIQSAKGGKIPIWKKGGSTVIDIEFHVDAHRRADTHSKTPKCSRISTLRDRLARIRGPHRDRADTLAVTARGALTCVRDRRKAADHRRCSAEERGAPEIGLEFCFPGSESQGRIVPEQGTPTALQKKRMLAFLRQLGYEFCTVSSDQVLAVEANVDELAMGRGEVQKITEESSKA